MLVSIACLLLVQYFEPQLISKNALVGLYALSLFLFAVLLGFILGSLRRDKQVWHLVNNLKQQIQDKESAQEKLQQTDFRLIRQQEVLAKLTANQLKNWRTPEEVFQQITQLSAETLEVERVAFWLFSDDQQILHCADIYHRSSGLHFAGEVLRAKEFPVYFQQLAKSRVIAAHDAMTHEATKEFVAEYLPAQGIGALLDGTIWLNDKIVGVVCHEHIGGAREWTLDEQNFVGSLADLGSLTIETHRRRIAEAELVEHQEQLEALVQLRTNALENNAKMFEFLVARAPAGILYMDTRGVVLDLNHEAERLSGYSKEFVIGKSYLDLFVPPGLEDQAKHVLARLVAGEKMYGQDAQLKRADGSLIDLSISRSLEIDSNGNPFILAIAQDMTQQKAAELALKQSEERFRFVLQRVPAAILYMDKTTKVIDMNPEIESISGYSYDYAIGKTFYALFSNKNIRKQHLTLFKRIISGEKLQGHELQMRRADGDVREYTISASLDYDKDGNPVILAIAQDMSIQKAIESELLKAREAAESADRIKSMFVASMSHELRTPLNSIIGFLSVVIQGMSGDINPKQRDQLNRAYHSAKHLLALISDVIDISKIEAGFLQVHKEKFDLLPLLEEAEQVVRHIATEKELKVKIACASNLMLETDRKRLYQVVLNFLSNAVKYTERGSVEVKVTQFKGQVSIAFIDTGIGIDSAGLAKLFTPFERVESRLKIRILGTGLGLYLTQKIATQLLGGTIEAQSQPEVGSVFTVKIPVIVPEMNLHEAASIL
ncbi:MAG: PAS domain S-box protein [Methylophilaceae bacterium]